MADDAISDGKRPSDNLNPGPKLLNGLTTLMFNLNFFE